MDKYKITKGMEDPEDFDVIENVPTKYCLESFRWIATFPEREHAELFVAALSNGLSNDPAPDCQLGTVKPECVLTADHIRDLMREE